MARAGKLEREATRLRQSQPSFGWTLRPSYWLIQRATDADRSSHHQQAAERRECVPGRVLTVVDAHV
jgi:hypothetical protein